MLRIWNVTLVIVTFFLTIFGTFMTRSGVVQSVHAFGDDPILARLFIGFMVAIVTFSFGLVIWRLPLLKSRNELDSWLSREAAFLVNNWVMLFAAFFVLFGTMFPTLSEAVTGNRITVAGAFFNKWMTPVGLILPLGQGTQHFDRLRVGELADRPAGAAGHDICFIHPRPNDAFPIAGAGVLIELVQAPADIIAAWQASHDSP